MQIKTQRFKGLEDGPHILIIGAIHGNEICGPEAMERILPSLDLKRGRASFIPVCNPLAYAKNIRYDTYNMNRIIGLYDPSEMDAQEKYFADQIAREIMRCDLLLDIHSFHTDGKPFVFEDYPTRETQKLAKATGLSHCVTGWPALYGSDTEKDTVGFAAKHHIPAVLVECGRHDDPQAINTAEAVILNVLSAYDMTDQRGSNDTDMTRIEMQKIIRKDRAGKLSKNWIHLDSLQKGETIALYEDGEVLKAENDGYIIMPSHDAAIGDEWFYIGQA